MNGTGPQPSSSVNGDFITSSLDLLQSKEQQKLLNIIDELRAYGISDLVSLPQIVVCGDQSSGKSSVLEAITEVPFPRKDTLCTRFATQIVLRRSPTNRVFVKIIPGNHRTPSERRDLARFSKSLDEFKQEELPDLIESASAAMGIRPASGVLSRDVLSIEISGPNRPQLTIVDLPGIIHTESGAQTQADINLVSEICDSYMSDPRTIILAVVTAANDIANQVILKWVRGADKTGTRTMGIITKPDTLYAGSGSEVSFVNLAKNEAFKLELGWHVMRNRGFETQGDSFAERNRVEEAFFNQGVWKHLPRDSVGVTTLRSKLSKLLLDHIKKALPTVFREIKAKLEECKEAISKLGVKRATTEEQRLFLTELGQDFFRLCKAATDGFYEDEFFGDARSDEGYEKRLRAVIQNSNRSFSKTMRIKGHRMEIVSEKTATGDSTQQPLKPLRKSRPEQLTRAEALEWVKTVLSRSRGRELPGTFNPLLVGELFWDQSAKWKSLAQDHVDNVWAACQRFVRTLLGELTTDVVFESLFTFYLDEVMENLLTCAKDELQRLFVDQRRHAMTYNHYCTDNVRKAREKRRLDASRESIMAALGAGSGSSAAGGAAGVVGGLLPKQLSSIDTQILVDSITFRSTETEMDMYACMELLDYMTAYYTVSLKSFVDNVATQVIERRIAGELWRIFSPVSVAAMGGETVANIASESAEVQTQRSQLEQQRDSLRKGLAACCNAWSISKSGASTLPGNGSAENSRGLASGGSSKSPQNVTSDSESEGESDFMADTEDTEIETPSPEPPQAAEVEPPAAEVKPPAPMPQPATNIGTGLVP